MTTIRANRNSAVALGAAGLAALAISLSWSPMLESSGSTGSLEAAPSWFAPVSAYYAASPSVTPSYDFASLYGTGAGTEFAPIARYYHQLIGPQFDFASLYGPADDASLAPLADYYHGRVGTQFDFASLYSTGK